MNTLNLKISNLQHGTKVCIDGQPIKLKKNEFGSAETQIQTENTDVILQIYNPKHELSGKHWFLMSILFFIVSIFGLFDKRTSKKFYSLEYSGVIPVNGNESLDIAIAFAKSGEKAITCKSGNFDDNESNIFNSDDVLKKRYKKVRLVKIATWIALPVIAIIIVLII